MPVHFHDFGAGFAAAAMAEVITLPVDTCKVKMQLDPMREVYKSSMHTVQLIRADRQTFFPGMTVAMMRSGVFNCCRLGIYDSVLERMARGSGMPTDSLVAKALAGVTVSAVAITCANPWDVVKASV